jgi:hypothetical protein
MQQRRLRLGDIVDDYCPRERRITNHAIVAMIEDEVKQTRCTTCEADHEYKQARVPAQRRKKEALSGPHPDGPGGPPRRRAPEGDAPFGDAPADEGLDSAEGGAGMEPAVSAAPDSDVPAGSDEPAPEPDTEHDPALEEDEGPVHRRLIRATLPRPEGQAPERKLPEFTAHQRDVNGNRHGRGRRGPRAGQTRGQQGSGGGQPRFGGPTRNAQGGNRQGPGFGQRHGSGQGQRQQSGRAGRGGRKRGR